MTDCIRQTHSSSLDISDHVSKDGSSESDVEDEENDGLYYEDPPHVENNNGNDTDMTRLLECFGLWGLDDNRAFCKGDLEKLNTRDRIRAIKPSLYKYYTPCKARVYLDQDDFTDRRYITILKQVIRSKGKTLLSRERNLQGRKTIFYQIINNDDIEKIYHMTKRGDGVVWISF
jgi:hypothetical protein